MEKLKVSVNEEGFALINCPSCGMVKRVSLEKYKGDKHNLKVRCACQEVLSVDLDFRKFYRKDTDLDGMLVNYSLVDPEKATAEDYIVRKCKILNISQGGLGIQIIGGHAVKVGDDLRVKFHLDNKSNTVIDRRVIVRVVRGKYLGCEFTDMEYHLYDRELGFYLMP